MPDSTGETVSVSSPDACELTSQEVAHGTWGKLGFDASTRARRRRAHGC